MWQTEHFRPAAVVIVTVYKDTRGRARAGGDHSLLRSGLIFIRSVLHFSPSNSDADTLFIMDSEAPLIQTAMEVVARATTSSSVLSFNLTGK